MKQKRIIELLILGSINLLTALNLPAVLAQDTSDKIIKFTIRGNNSISDPELQKVLAPYLNLDLSWDNVLVAKNALTQYYQKLGYPSALALIPEQDLSGNIIIDLNEGKLASIEIEGNRLLSTQWIESQIDRNRAVNISELDRELRLIRKNSNLIEDLKAQLIPGSQLGTSQLFVQITERKPQYWSYELNNYATPVSGRWENSATYLNPSLTRKSDLLGLRVGITQGGTTINGLYDWAVNSQGTRAQISFGRLKRQVTEDPISILDLQSSATSISVGLRSPLVREPERDLAVNVGVDWQKNQTRLDGELFPFDNTSDNGKTEIWAVRLGLQANFQSLNSATIASSQLSLGVGNGEKTFMVWNNSLDYYRKFGKITAIAKVSAQIADSNLFAEEQFTLGGKERGRGYRLNEFSGDNGVFGALEVQVPLSPQISVSPFFETGRVWGQGYGTTVISTGVSANWQINRNLSLRGDVAFPLNSPDNSENFLFSIQYQP
ncbi:ShlB/FhaC/HecB family hemolysin secretion/activation protein [Merismopedia glauca]|uniref:ShlB/FhaC/HecB family hemolysin secretion/activation protein n=1 Tax=Merismopedia glauca CCAP 1448/3 TaxID=1296344 RepID=A0A2T1BZN0_9CYAN|nr:ShlB/FhaC/HecB family hemolysin secretion/activation protein [Merismopedia glauca]PSB01368.1 hypothetical protein C7B64_18705 [Merismopedia glauca CCAP 1448/3]